MPSRWTQLLAVVILVTGVVATAFAGDEPDRVDSPDKPEIAKKVIGGLDELLAGIIAFAEERKDLSQEASERIGQLAARARELKPMLDTLPQRIQIIEKRIVEPGKPGPELEKELRRIKDEMMDVENGIRDIEKAKGERSAEARAKLEKLAARRDALKADGDRLRDKMKAAAERRPMGEPGMPRIEGEIAVYRLENADPQFVSDVLMRLLPPGSSVIPDKRTGKLLVITHPDAYGRAERVVGELDEPGRDRRESDRRESDRRDMKPDNAPRYDYERPDRPRESSGEPDRPKVERTVGKVVEVGDHGFVVQAVDSGKRIEFQYPSHMQPDRKPVPNEEFVKRIGKLKGETVVVEWSEIEGSRVSTNIAPAPDAKPVDGKGKPSEGKDKESTIVK